MGKEKKILDDSKMYREQLEKLNLTLNAQNEADMKMYKLQYDTIPNLEKRLMKLKS